MWTGFSEAAQDAIAGNCQLAVAVEVWSPTGVFLEDITYALSIESAGTVVEDETASVRRTCTLTFNDPNLVPSVDTDLLNPLSSNELKVYRGVWVPGEAEPEYAPLGVFRIADPVTTDTGANLTLQVTGNDRSSVISANSWTGPYTAAAGKKIPAAIKGIINQAWEGPPLLFNMYPSNVTVPAGTVLGVQFTSDGVQAESGSTGGGNDPWADCVALAQSAGCELFFDRVGTVVMRQVPEPGTAASVAVFAEGAGCTVVQGTRSLDVSSFYNEVIVIGTGVMVTNSDGSTSPGDPVVATASSNDPLLGVEGPMGARPDFIVDQTISVQSDAQAAANAQLSKVMSEADSTSFQAVENPALDAGDQVTLVRARMKLDGAYIIQSITHPLDSSTAMSVTNRSFAVSV